MTEIETIAKGLSQAQRKTITDHPDGNPWLDEYTTPEWPNIHTRADLHGLGEMRPNAVFNHAWRLTERGQAVRDYLKGQPC